MHVDAVTRDFDGNRSVWHILSCHCTETSCEKCRSRALTDLKSKYSSSWPFQRIRASTGKSVSRLNVCSSSKHLRLMTYHLNASMIRAWQYISSRVGRTSPRLVFRRRNRLFRAIQSSSNWDANVIEGKGMGKNHSQSNMFCFLFRYVKQCEKSR